MTWDPVRSRPKLFEPLKIIAEIHIAKYKQEETNQPTSAAHRRTDIPYLEAVHLPPIWISGSHCSRYHITLTLIGDKAQTVTQQRLICASMM